MSSLASSAVKLLSSSPDTSEVVYPDDSPSLFIVPHLDCVLVLVMAAPPVEELLDMRFELIVDTERQHTHSY